MTDQAGAMLWCCPSREDIMGKLFDLTFDFEVKAVEKTLKELREKGILSILDMDSQQVKMLVYYQLILIHSLLAILAEGMPEKIQREFDKVSKMSIGELLSKINVEQEKE
jgi:hypothetical protein